MSQESNRRWLSALALVPAIAAATYALAHAWQPVRLLHIATWIVIGFILLPIACSLALGVAATLLTVVLGLVSVPAWIAGRPTGLRPLLADLWHLPADILPSLWSKLRGFDRPEWLGAAAGFVGGVAWFSLQNGLTAH